MRNDISRCAIRVTRAPEIKAPMLQNAWNLDIILFFRFFSICAAMEFIETSTVAQTTPEIKSTADKKKKVLAIGINANVAIKIDPKYKQEFLFPIFWIKRGAVKKPIKIPKGCMNKARDNSIKFNPIADFTSGILSNQRDRPSDCVTKNILRAVTGLRKLFKKDINFLLNTNIYVSISISSSSLVSLLKF